MSPEQDVQQLEASVKSIEDYVNRGTWNPDQHKEILSEIDKTDVIFDKIINSYIDMPERPSIEQAYLVSNLQEKLHHIKHNLPSPPSGQESKSGKTDKEVAIYTTPT